jgi:hypothetical protein
VDAPESIREALRVKLVFALQPATDFLSAAIGRMALERCQQLCPFWGIEPREAFVLKEFLVVGKLFSKRFAAD